MSAVSSKIYLCRYGQWDMAAFIKQHSHCLDSHDLARFQQFKHTDASHQFFIGHVVLRHLLSEYLQQPAASFCFTNNQHGRPCLASGAMDFNISHTEGLVVVALAPKSALGVDVECKHRRGKTLEIADRFFHPQEINCIGQPVAELDQRALFFRFWTLKEAYVKALGDGLQRSLQSFYFTLHTNGHVRLNDSVVAANEHNSQVMQYQLWQEYYLAWVHIAEPGFRNSPALFEMQADLNATALHVEPEYQS